MSSLPSFLHPTDDGQQEIWYSVLIFATAQLFLSGEKVLEESVFDRYAVDVFVVFFFTLWTQVTLGWLYYPAQGIVVFGNITISEIPNIVTNGLRCTVGLQAVGVNSLSPSFPECDWHNPFFFFVYCFVDYLSYASGLWLIQLCGANLMVLATAIQIPLVNIIYASPIMGRFQNHFQVADGAALLLVLGGFALFQLSSPEGREKLGWSVEPPLITGSVTMGKRPRFYCCFASPLFHTIRISNACWCVRLYVFFVSSSCCVGQQLSHCLTPDLVATT